MSIRVSVEPPVIPERFTVRPLRALTLAQADASGERYMVDIADLDADAIEQLVALWGARLRARWADRRQTRLLAAELPGAPKEARAGDAGAVGPGCD